MATIVTNGISAFFSACTSTTVDGASPFACATRTYSWLSTSIMLDRSNRVNTAVCKVPSATAGRMNGLRLAQSPTFSRLPMPVIGSQSSRMAKT